MRVGITATGSYLPTRSVSSDELQREVAQGSGLKLPEGIIKRVTGIAERRVTSSLEYASTLAIEAGKRALQAAGLTAVDIDTLLFASASRDMVEPATCHIVQQALGATAHALDINNACNSFINGTDIARSMILAGRARRVLVVTGETPTRTMRTRPENYRQFRDSFAGYTFGDAGSALIVEQVPRGGITYVDSITHSEYWNVGGIIGGGSRHPRGDEYSYFQSDGVELRKIFERIGPQIIKDLFARTEMSWADFRYVLAHQVTLPYLRRFAEVTGAPTDKLIETVSYLGNVGSATLGIQLDQIQSHLAPGDRVLLIGLGGGISVMLMVWEKS
jgi:3-oxoacyl-(acyl-carrier-protein) synthase III